MTNQIDLGGATRRERRLAEFFERRIVAFLYNARRCVSVSGNFKPTHSRPTADDDGDFSSQSAGVYLVDQIFAAWFRRRKSIQRAAAAYSCVAPPAAALDSSV